jgi:multisubunit Na+/H+ antiporter MnhG subunit
MCDIPYIAYVTNSEDIIIDSLADNWVSLLLEIFYTIAIGFSVPIMMYPISEAVYRSKIFDPHVKLFRDYPQTKFYSGAITGLLTCLIISNIIDDLDSYFNIVGSVIGVLTTIVFPWAFYNKAHEKTISPGLWWFHILLWTFCSVLGAIAFVASILDRSGV